MIVVSYRRVSTSGQDVGLDVQRDTIDGYLKQRGWTLDYDYVEKQSAKDMDRPELQRAIGVVEAQGGVLVVAKLDRLSRSVADFASLADRARKKGWRIVAIDLGLDMTSPTGELVAHIMAAMSQWERRLIGERTKAALAVKKQQGVHCGRPRAISAGTLGYIRGMAAQGWTPTKIARWLTESGAPTPRGGKVWSESTIRKVLS